MYLNKTDDGDPLHEGTCSPSIITSCKPVPLNYKLAKKLLNLITPKNTPPSPSFTSLQIIHI